MNLVLCLFLTHLFTCTSYFRGQSYPPIKESYSEDSFYGCKTWSLTLREEQCLRAFENRVLRRILGPKREEVAVGWRRLHNEELHNFYTSG